jgi:hypothetical protein
VGRSTAAAKQRASTRSPHLSAGAPATATAQVCSCATAPTRAQAFLSPHPQVLLRRQLGCLPCDPHSVPSSVPRHRRGIDQHLSTSCGIVEEGGVGGWGGHLACQRLVLIQLMAGWLAARQPLPLSRSTNCKLVLY